MLNIQCEEHLDKVVEFAESRKIIDKLAMRLEYLDKYACQKDPEHTKCDIFQDFAPYSFAFTMNVKNRDNEYEPWFQGGLIYHGDGSSGAEFPVLSVRIGELNEDWGIHT